MERTPAESVAEPLVMNPLLGVSGDAVMAARGADVGANRERQRRRRLWKLAVTAGIPAGWLWWRFADGRPVDLLRLPHIDPFFALIFVFFLLMILTMLGQFVFARRSPHIVYRPEQIDVRMKDVVGIELVKEEVIRSLNLFLSHKTFAGQMGGTPRRGLLFEGAPGTGKTYLAKAMAAEAGVPFLFVSATSFQSMWYGATAGKIKSYFKAVRKAARAEGGAIAFIEEIDAIATTRGGMNGMTAAPDPMKMVTCCGSVTSLPATYLSPAGNLVQNRVAVEGVGGVVNELLVQLQSFDDPTGMQKLYGKLVSSVNLLLPPDRQLAKPKPQSANVLVIAATNRADSLDPALLRPGRFDRRLTFDLPDKAGRRDLIDHFLARKSHHDEIDEERRDALASITHGYTPVMIEHLFDEALVNAVRRGDNKMTWVDVERARLTEEVGLGQPVTYTEHEKRLIATHEAGHATAAYLVAPTRRLEVLSIIKRREALGLLAHGDADEVYTRSRSEMLSLIQIALAGQSAEEIFFGDVSTGPGGDLLYATNVAAQMVGASGMTSTLISYAAVQNSAFNDTNIVGRVLADAEGRRRVEDLLQEQKVVIKAKLESNAHLVAALRDQLLERNELIGKEIKAVLDSARDADEQAGVASPDAIPVEPAAARVVDLRDQSNRRRTVVSPTEPTADE